MQWKTLLRNFWGGEVAKVCDFRSMGVTWLRGRGGVLFKEYVQPYQLLGFRGFNYLWHEGVNRSTWDDDNWDEEMEGMSKGWLTWFK